MSVTEDKIEQERIARQTAIKQVLEVDAEPVAAPEDGSKASAAPKLVAIDQTSDGTIIYRKMKPWEAMDARGRVFQYRPMTSREIEAETDRQFMESQRRQDEAHAAKVQEAIKEAQREQKRLDQKREHEARTGRRAMGKDTISLEEARRRGYLASENASQGKPEWWSPGNPEGIMGGGR
jgi:hypothetical protein